MNKRGNNRRVKINVKFNGNAFVKLGEKASRTIGSMVRSTSIINSSRALIACNRLSSTMTHVIMLIKLSHDGCKKRRFLFACINLFSTSVPISKIFSAYCARRATFVT